MHTKGVIGLSKEKVKKPFYKKWWAWLIVIIVVIAIAGGGDDDKEQASEVDTEQPKVTANKEDEQESKKEAKKEETVVAGIGTALDVGKTTFTVNNKESTDQVGPSVLPQKASEKYVVIEVTFKNNGNEAVTMDTSFYKLKLGEKTYDADSMGSISANQGDDGSIDNSFFLQSVNPDSTISGKVVFDVAESVATSEDLQLQVQTGFFGTETGIIDLK